MIIRSIFLLIWSIEGDTIKWREGSKKTEYYKTMVEGIKAKTVPAWLSLDRENMVGQVTGLPSSDVLKQSSNLPVWSSGIPDKI